MQLIELHFPDLSSVHVRSLGYPPHLCGKSFVTNLSHATVVESYRKGLKIEVKFKQCITFHRRLNFRNTFLSRINNGTCQWKEDIFTFLLNSGLAFGFGVFLLLIAFFFLVDWLVWCSGFSKLRSENHKKKKSSKSSKLLQIIHTFNFVLSILKLSSTEWFRTLKEVVISLLKFFVHSNEEQHEVPNLLKESAQLLL